VDSTEDVLFYNEAAGVLLGRSFEETREMPLRRLSEIFLPITEEGTPLAPDALPLGIALKQRRPAHRRFKFRGLDGVWRTIEVTAFPIIGQESRPLGAAAIFWEVDPS
jgi:PAS domain-containing protein